jgi:hypothetical protein
VQAVAQQWQTIPGSLTSLSAAADGSVWGTNSSGSVFRFSGSGWQAMPGSLAQISAGGSQNVWGVNANLQVFQWDASSSTWKPRPGGPTSVSASGSGNHTTVAQTTIPARHWWYQRMNLADNRNLIECGIAEDVTDLLQ